MLDSTANARAFACQCISAVPRLRGRNGAADEYWKARLPRPQAALLEHDACAAQALLLKRGDQRIALERTHEKQEIATAAGTQQFSPDSTMGFREIVDIVELVRRYLGAQLALGVPGL